MLRRPYPDLRTLLVGDDSAGVTPDPIPNSVVKLRGADGTARATLWESRYRRPIFAPRGAMLRGVSYFELLLLVVR
jgi:hypothetical protein